MAYNVCAMGAVPAYLQSPEYDRSEDMEALPLAKAGIASLALLFVCTWGTFIERAHHVKLRILIQYSR